MEAVYTDRFRPGRAKRHGVAYTFISGVTEDLRMDQIVKGTRNNVKKLKYVLGVAEGNAPFISSVDEKLDHKLSLSAPVHLDTELVNVGLVLNGGQGGGALRRRSHREADQGAEKWPPDRGGHSALAPRSTSIRNWSMSGLF